jgi:hypothetical protein
MAAKKIQPTNPTNPTVAPREAKKADDKTSAAKTAAVGAKRSRKTNTRAI